MEVVDDEVFIYPDPAFNIPVEDLPLIRGIPPAVQHPDEDDDQVVGDPAALRAARDDARRRARATWPGRARNLPATARRVPIEEISRTLLLNEDDLSIQFKVIMEAIVASSVQSPLPAMPDSATNIPHTVRQITPQGAVYAAPRMSRLNFHAGPNAPQGGAGGQMDPEAGAAPQ